MIKIISKGKEVQVNPATLPNIITSIEYDHDAQQAVFFYQPVEGYDLVFAIIPVELDEVPYHVSLETLGINNETLFNNTNFSRS